MGPDITPFLRFWRSQDALLERVEPTIWGAVVTDSRFPEIHDVNYARVEPGHPGLAAADVEAALAPALKRVGRSEFHCVLFDPDANAELIAECSSRGDRLSWDVAMVHDRPPPPSAQEPDEVTELDDEFWRAFRSSLALFGEIGEAEAAALERLERETVPPGTKRWFAVRDDGGEIVSLASLTVLEGIGYLDHVATFPRARGRGNAGELTARAIAEARAAGVDEVWLLVEPGGRPEALYRRLGFGEAGRLASFLGPLR